MKIQIWPDSQSFYVLKKDLKIKHAFLTLILLWRLSASFLEMQDQRQLNDRKKID